MSNQETPPVQSLKGIKNFVVILHGFTMNTRQYKSLERLVMNTYKDAKVFLPDLPLSHFSTETPDLIVDKLLDDIDKMYVDTEPDIVVTLIGHSTGALLVRYLAVKADKQGKKWMEKVKRVVLLAGINKGWSINSDLSLWTLLMFTAGCIAGWFMEKVLRKKPFVFFIRKNSPFIHELNRDYKELSEKRGAEFLTIQLLGTRDNILAAGDDIDSELGSNFAYLELPATNHTNLIDINDSEEGLIRKKIIKIALNDDREILKKYKPNNLSFDLLHVLKEEYEHLHGEKLKMVTDWSKGIELKNNSTSISFIEKLKHDPDIETISNYSLRHEVMSEYKKIILKNKKLVSKNKAEIVNEELIDDYRKVDTEGKSVKIVQPTLEILKLGKLKTWIKVDMFEKEFNAEIDRKKQQIANESKEQGKIITEEELIDEKTIEAIIDKIISEKDIICEETISSILNEKAGDMNFTIVEDWLEIAPLQAYTRALLDRYKNTHEAANNKDGTLKVFFIKAGKLFRKTDQARIKSADIVKYDAVYKMINILVLEDVYSELLQNRIQKDQDSLYTEMYNAKTSALCLSGGGIRSASFALGVVQQLARKDSNEASMLNNMSYLSTVSGGGYLGGWLSAWIHQDTRAKVIEEINDKQKTDLEPAPVRYLRQYTNYLSPVVGFFSADTWTLLAIYLRNLFLNWLILIPFLAGIIAAPWFFVAVLNCKVNYACSLLMMLVGTLAYLGSDYYVNKFPPQNKEETIEGLNRKGKTQQAFLLECLLPGASGIMCWAIGWYWFYNGEYIDEPESIRDFQAVFRRQDWESYMVSGLITGLYVLVKYLLFWAFEARGMMEGRNIINRKGWARFVDLFRNVAPGFLAGPLIYGVYILLDNFNNDPGGSIIYLWVSFPAFISIILFMGFLYEGFRSKQADDAEREWMARYSGWFLIVALCWIFIAGLVLYTPLYLTKQIGYVISFSGLIGYVTAYLGQKSWSPGSIDKTKKTDVKSKILSYLSISSLAFLAFMVLIIAISLGDIWLISIFINAISKITEFLSFLPRVYANVEPSVYEIVTVNPAWPFLLILAMFFLAFRFSRYVDSNRFSLHAMYRARLIRAYLGAGRPEGVRRPNPFTGFDESDNIYMGSIAVSSAKDGAASQRNSGESSGEPHVKLFHVINMALNLVNGRNLAWQERKAGSFTVSPLHAGSLNLGYRRTFVETAQGKTIPEKNSAHYGGERGISLGTAMTISGAAVSPNMGYNTSSLVAFFMTLFNLRLGAWLGNPGPGGDESFNNSSPQNFVNPIFKEMFGLTNDLNDYVYLSDGGHFENLGLYEMVLRRNRFIVVSDASCDENCGLEDLGNAIRKIRIDLGVHIDFPWGFDIYSRKSEKKGKYWALGRIRYPSKHLEKTEGKAKNTWLEGVLLYLKPGIYGTEPKDIFNYATVSTAFPHESTADQFFTESQFESYRALGFYAMEQALSEIKKEYKFDLKHEMLDQKKLWHEKLLKAIYEKETKKNKDKKPDADNTKITRINPYKK